MSLQDIRDWIFLEKDVYTVLEEITNLMLRCHKVVFILLFLAAVTGKKTGLRRAYIATLDKIFNFAAAKIQEKETRERNKSGENFADEIGHDEHEEDESVVICPDSPRVSSIFSSSETFHLGDLIPYATVGMQSVAQDLVSTRFDPEHLDSWNMLSRTKTKSTSKQAASVTFLWLFGFFIRYVYLLPVRLVIFTVSFSNLILCTFLVGLLPSGKIKRKINAVVNCWCFDFVANSVSVFARFHDVHNRAEHGVAVSNHTSPIDTMVLATDNYYDMVGQKTKGVLGWFMGALSRSSTHIWFERSNSKDRSTVTKLMQAHASNVELPPILIFPEGVCVNNTAVLLFRKGVFELDAVIHPIAMRFDARYCDAFWWQAGFFQHILCMMSSWAMVCDIWYLPPMKRRQNESPAAFADRVRTAIARKGGFQKLQWDGFVKTISDQRKQQKEEVWRKNQQKELAKIFPRESQSDVDGAAAPSVQKMTDT